MMLRLCLFLALIAAPALADEPSPSLSVLIVDGMNNHDWQRATRVLGGILESSGRFTVDVSTSPAAGAPQEQWDRWRPQFAKFDVVLSNFNGGHTAKGVHWPREVEQALEDYVGGGGGLVIYHSANNSFLNWPAYNEMIGLGWRGRDFGPSLIVGQDEKVVIVPKGRGRGPGHGPEHDIEVTVLNADHPITKGLPKRWMHPHEQLTHGQHGPAKNMTILSYAHSKDTGDNEVMDWVIPYGKGRVYVTMLGHLWRNKPDTAMRCIGFQTMVIRGCEWAATGKVTYPVPKDFPTATEIRLIGQPDAATSPNEGTVAGSTGPRSTAAPYPPSPIIKSLTIHSDRQSIGNGDNWPITWADDDDQYTVYCDGKGFGGGSGEGSMSLAKITGSPPSIQGQNIVSPSGHKTGGGESGRKASGLLMVDAVLYMWVRNLNKDGTGSSLAWSKDRARTWTWASWDFPEIGYPVWLNAGRNYEAAQDEYAYFYWPDTPSAYKTSDRMMMGRIRKGRITQRDAFVFFAGLDDQGKPEWTTDLKDRKPVFTDAGHCYRPDVVYDPALKRYLLCTATSGAARWCGTDSRYLGIFDSPHPWGPWTTVTQIEGWGGEENRFQPRIPSKWISEDGKGCYLLYSCFPKGPYKFNVQKCTLQLVP